MSDLPTAGVPPHGLAPSKPGHDSDLLLQLLNGFYHEGLPPAVMPGAGGVPRPDVSMTPPHPVITPGLGQSLPGPELASVPFSIDSVQSLAGTSVAAPAGPVPTPPVAPHAVAAPAMPGAGEAPAVPLPGMQGFGSAPVPGGGTPLQHLDHGGAPLPGAADLPAAELASAAAAAPGPRAMHELAGEPALPKGMEHDTLKTEPYWLQSSAAGKSVESMVFRILPMPEAVEQTHIVDNLPKPPKRPPDKPPANEFFINKLTAMSGQDFTKQGDAAGTSVPLAASPPLPGVVGLVAGSPAAPAPGSPVVPGRVATTGSSAGSGAPGDIPVIVDQPKFEIPEAINLVPGPRELHEMAGSPNVPPGIEHDNVRTEPYWLQVTAAARSLEHALFEVLPLPDSIEPTHIVENLPKPPKRPPEKPPAKEFFINKATAMSGGQILAPGHSKAPVVPVTGSVAKPPAGFYWAPSAPGMPAAGTAQAAGSAPVKAGTPDHFDVETVRKDFPILRQQVNGKPLVWLDNAATTQKPQAVIDRISKFYEEENSNIHRAAHHLAAKATDAYEAAREKVRKFLGAPTVNEIIFTRGTTESINLVANTYGRQHLRKDDEIILSEVEHHSNIVPWQMITKETGARIRVAPIFDSGEINLDAYQRLFNSRTRMVAITHVSNALGTVLPVREMVSIAHQHGVRVLVDGAQSVPHFPVNVQEIDADFYAMSGHKLFGPTGIGVLYGRAELLELMPPWQGGGNMIEKVTFEKTTYNPPPSKFEAGTGILAGAVGLGAAIDYLERIGFAHAARYEDELLHHAQDRLSRIKGVRMIGTAPNKAGVVSFVTTRITPQQMGVILNAEGIAVRTGHHCAQPALAHYGLQESIRPSIAFYNTRAEIDLLVRTVEKALRDAP